MHPLNKLALLLLMGQFLQEVRCNEIKAIFDCNVKNCAEDGDEEVKSGRAVCTYTKEHNHPMFQRKCAADCSPGKIADDQLKCACDACKVHALAFTNFCKEPGGDHIGSKENCDSAVCNGQVPYRGKHCKW